MSDRVANGTSEKSRAVLDPVERLSEVLFGLIMALTFTGSLSAATAGHEDVRTMLFGAIGCNIAWGIVDAVIYLFTSLTARARALTTVLTVRRAQVPEEAHRIIADALPPLVGNLIRTSELERLRLDLVNLQNLPARARLHVTDFRAALGVFLLVFLSTFPVVVPFLFIAEPVRALRTSNAIAVTMLFLIGYSLGRYAGHRPWLMGISMLGVGVALVAATIALGG